MLEITDVHTLWYLWLKYSAGAFGAREIYCIYGTRLMELNDCLMKKCCWAHKITKRCPKMCTPKPIPKLQSMTSFTAQQVKQLLLTAFNKSRLGGRQRAAHKRKYGTIVTYTEGGTFDHRGERTGRSGWLCYWNHPYSHDNSLLM